MEKNKITLKELENMKDNERTYKPIGTLIKKGKMFILKQKDQLIKEIGGQNETFEKNIEEYSQNQKHYDNKIKNFEKQLQEMVAAYQKSQQK